MHSTITRLIGTVCILSLFACGGGSSLDDAASSSPASERSSSSASSIPVVSSASSSSSDSTLSDIPLQSQITKVQPMTGIVLWADSHNSSVLKT